MKKTARFILLLLICNSVVYAEFLDGINSVDYLPEKALENRDIIDYINNEGRFSIDGHNFNGRISAKEINLQLPYDEEMLKYTIKMVFDEDSIDDLFFATFQSEKHEVYGVIRQLKELNCYFSLGDGFREYEIYLNYRGIPYKACGVIEK